MKITTPLFFLLFSTFKLKFVETWDIIERRLQDDIQDFLTLIPTNKVKDVLAKYTQEDEEFLTEVYNIVFAEEFELLTFDVLNWLDEFDLPVNHYIKEINDFMGKVASPPYKSAKSKKRLGGISGFLYTIKEYLPIATIRKLYKQKLKESLDFLVFIEESQNEVYKSRQNQHFNVILKLAKTHGVDLNAVTDFIDDIFEIQLPILKPF